MTKNPFDKQTAIDTNELDEQYKIADAALKKIVPTIPFIIVVTIVSIGAWIGLMYSPLREYTIPIMITFGLITSMIFRGWWSKEVATPAILGRRPVNSTLWTHFTSALFLYVMWLFFSLKTICITFVVMKLWTLAFVFASIHLLKRRMREIEKLKENPLYGIFNYLGAIHRELGSPENQPLIDEVRQTVDDSINRHSGLRSEIHSGFATGT